MHNDHRLGHAPDEMKESGSAPTLPTHGSTTTNSPHFLRRFHELQARLLTRRFKFKRGSDGELLILRWDCCKVVPDLDGAEAFAKQVGAI